MGLINLPFPNLIANTLARAAHVLSNFTTIYNEFNGNITNANISSSAEIFQSKIRDLVPHLAGKVNDTGDTITGPLILRGDGPSLRFTGTESSARDFRIIESSGVLVFQRNDGSESSPNWTSVFHMRWDSNPVGTNDVVSKAYVDARTAELAIAEAVFDSSPDFTTVSDDFEDIPGFSTQITLTNAHRVRVSTQLSGISNDVDPAAVISFRIRTGAGALGASQIQINATGGHASHSFYTTVLAAGTHTFQLEWKTSHGLARLKAAGDAQARMQLEEMVR